jgi:hypothetical protein
MGGKTVPLTPLNGEAVETALYSYSLKSNPFMEE